MFRTCANKGFHLTIGDYVLSVQWGPSNYCENRSYATSEDYLCKPGPDLTSPDCEIAVWGTDGTELLQIAENDTVAGRVSAETVGKVAGYLSSVVGLGTSRANVVAVVRSIVGG